MLRTSKRCVLGVDQEEPLSTGNLLEDNAASLFLVTCALLMTSSAVGRYHELMKIGIENNASAWAWQNHDKPGAHTARSALSYMLYQMEAGTQCPQTMTYVCALLVVLVVLVVPFKCTLSCCCMNARRRTC